jgi:hypothetical protein
MILSLLFQSIYAIIKKNNKMDQIRTESLLNEENHELFVLLRSRLANNVIAIV